MKKGIFRKAGTAALSALTAGAIGLIPMAGPAQAVEGFAFERLGGEDRYDTARVIAADTFTSADTVIVARGDGTVEGPQAFPPDALAGSYLAGEVQGPILLVPKNNTTAGEKDAVNDTQAAIEALGASRIIILGGNEAISESVENELATTQGVTTVDRVFGQDRFETAAAVAEEGGATGTVDGKTVAFLANGRSGVDALAAGPESYDADIPILLTNPDELSASAAAFIEDNDIERVYILGGPEAVSQDVEDDVAALNDGSTETPRLAGADRRDTAIDIAVNLAFEKLGFDESHINLANGEAAHLVDSITGGPHGGRDRAVTVLAAGVNNLGDDTRAFIASMCPTLQDGHIFGGPLAVSPQVEAGAEAAAASCGGAGTPGEATALALTPETDINPVGSNHTVTANVTDAEDDPAEEGTLVRFEVYRDSDPGAGTGNFAFVTGGFDTSTGGTADFTYTGPATNAQDVIVSCVVANQATACTSPAGTLTRDPVSGQFNNITADIADTARKEFTRRQAQTLTLTPETDVNAVGENHTVTATVTDQFGDPVSGTAVKFELFVDTDYDGNFVQTNEADTTTGGGTPPANPLGAGKTSYTFTSDNGSGVYQVVACVETADADTDCATTATGGSTDGPVRFDADERAIDNALKEFVSLKTASAANGGNANGRVVAQDNANTVDVFTSDNQFLRYTYTPGADTLQVNGKTVSEACFEAAASNGDSITISNYSLQTDQATFNVTDADNSGLGCQNL